MYRLPQWTRRQSLGTELPSASVGATDPSATTIKLRQWRKLQGLQREWLERFGSGEGFEKALVSVSDVVAGTCVGIAAAGRIEDTEFDLVVIDEASKATPTEALVAMTRGKRWVLVGDQRQLPPFTDDEFRDKSLLAEFDLLPEHLTETLFDRMIAGVPPECKPRLTVQHRMIAAIGDLISSCFYDGELESRRVKAGKTAPSRLLKKSVTWFSTTNLANRHEQQRANRNSGSPSFVNFEEAKRIHRWLDELENMARQCRETLSVGVISGYVAQKDLLFQEIDPRAANRWKALSIEINSVDAFQGREVDVLIYSATRSNVQSKIGFLAFEQRLNVALSRGRDALIIFGDATHCRYSVDEGNPFPGVLNYMEAHPEACAIEVL